MVLVFGLGNPEPFYVDLLLAFRLPVITQELVVQYEK